jgi:hypothetical protein
VYDLVIMGDTTFGFQKTYELVPDAPPSMPWDEYERASVAEYLALIAGLGREDEALIHGFLERNPAFVPGAFSYPRSGHAPIHYGVFSKPRLSGEPGYIPDFLWLATATDQMYPMFVEIETPAKRWFTASGQPTAQWTQAYDQILNWKRWLKNPAQMQTWINSLNLPYPFNRGYEFHPQFVLIYGSATEFDERSELRSKRREMAQDDTFLMTFDHLRPDANADDFMTLRRDGRRVIAVTVPPTYRLRPIITEDILEVQGRIEAVQREARFSEERRRFLVERIPYWDAWLRTDKRGVIVSSDCE